jgi:DNA-binding NarL/FixJ family response regulator
LMNKYLPVVTRLQKKYRNRDNFFIFPTDFKSSRIVYFARMIEQKKNVTIGISEDHPKLRERMKLCLDEMGYSVILVTENGKLFIEKLNRDLLPDVCLLDINMPVMNGYETTIYLKNNWPSVKVLIHSMCQSTRSKEKAFSCGADGYLIKPSTIDELEAAIQKIIQ